jgi:hypothetical protein
MIQGRNKSEIDSHVLRFLGPEPEHEEGSWPIDNDTQKSKGFTSSSTYACKVKEPRHAQNDTCKQAKDEIFLWSKIKLQGGGTEGGPRWRSSYHSEMGVQNHVKEAKAW